MKRRAYIGTLGALSMAGCLQLADENQTNGGAGGEVADGGGSTESGTDGSTEEGQDGTDGTNDDEADEGPGEEGRGTEDGDPDYPQGMSEDGVSSLLADVVRRELRDRSYRIEHVEDLVSEGRVLRDVDAVVGEKRALVDRSGHAPADIYCTGDERVWRAPVRGTRRYGTNDLGFDWRLSIKAEFLAAAFDAVEFGAPERVEVDGTTVFRVESTGVADEGALRSVRPVGDLETADAALVVGTDGLLREFEADVVYMVDGEERLAPFRTAVSDVDAATVSEPDWVATARERAPQLSVSVGEGLSHVTYVHEGGDPIPTETHVGVREHAAPGGGTLPLKSPLEAGDRLHVWIDDGEVHTSRSEPPSDSRPLTEHWTNLSVQRVIYFKRGVEEL